MQVTEFVALCVYIVLLPWLKYYTVLVSKPLDTVLVSCDHLHDTKSVSHQERSKMTNQPQRKNLAQSNSSAKTTHGCFRSGGQIQTSGH